MVSGTFLQPGNVSLQVSLSKSSSRNCSAGTGQHFYVNYGELASHLPENVSALYGLCV